jgi:hypothetical protein
LRSRRCASREAGATIVNTGFADPWVGITLPSAMNRFGTSHARWLESTTLPPGIGAHPGAADEAGVAIDRERANAGGQLAFVVWSRAPNRR